jgi:hypothetical protein
VPVAETVARPLRASPVRTEALTATEVRRVTDQVLAAIEQRSVIWRERTGRV